MAERVDALGNIAIDIDEAELVNKLAKLRAAKVEGLVVFFLNSHRNGSHERRVLEIVEASDWAPFILFIARYLEPRR